MTKAELEKITKNAKEITWGAIGPLSLNPAFWGSASFIMVALIQAAGENEEFRKALLED